MSQINTSPAQEIIRLQNIRTQQQVILQEIAQLVRDSDLESHRSQTVLNLLTQTVARIEQLCVQQQLAPANLSRPSRQVYAWMKFLVDEHHLLQHVRATQRIQQLADKKLRSIAFPGLVRYN